MAKRNKKLEESLSKIDFSGLFRSKPKDKREEVIERQHERSDEGQQKEGERRS